MSPDERFLSDPPWVVAHPDYVKEGNLNGGGMRIGFSFVVSSLRGTDEGQSGISVAPGVLVEWPEIDEALQHAGALGEVP